MDSILKTRKRGKNSPRVKLYSRHLCLRPENRRGEHPFLFDRGKRDQVGDGEGKQCSREEGSSNLVMRAAGRKRALGDREETKSLQPDYSSRSFSQGVRVPLEIEISSAQVVKGGRETPRSGLRASAVKERVLSETER